MSKRETETRDTQTRYVYTPPSALPHPNPQPGWQFRYIAISVLNEAADNNVSKKFRDGWEPVRAEDHPELKIQGNKNGNVEIGGLLLCKMPEERAVARNEYYQKQAAAQIESVDNHFMRNNDPRMPLFSDRKSTTTKGTGY
jgi:hypothetical protein